MTATPRAGNGGSASEFAMRCDWLGTTIDAISVGNDPELKYPSGQATSTRPHWHSSQDQAIYSVADGKCSQAKNLEK